MPEGEHEDVVELIVGAVDAAALQLWYIASDPRIAAPSLAFSIPFPGGEASHVELSVDSDGDVMWGERVIVYADGTPARADD